MAGKWTVIKNLGWAVAILVCLLALVVGFVIASVNRYSGAPISASTEIRSETVANSENVTELTASEGGGSLLTLPETNDAGQEYIDKLTFLCDSSFVGVRDYGLLSGGTNTYQVWATDTGSLPIGSIMEKNIIYPSDGSEISIADAAMIAKPAVLVICVGQDGLNQVDEAAFKNSYTSLIQSIRTSSPDTIIICCSISSVINNYTGADNLTTIMISDANDWIMDVCRNTGVYFAETGKSVGDGTGSVLTSYLSTNGKTLNSSGITEILKYLSKHALTLD